MRRRAAPFGLAAVGVAADLAFDPTTNHVPLCPLHALTGLWCPFCGGLRAVVDLARLHVGAAVSANLLVVAAVPLLLVSWSIAAAGRPPLRHRLSARRNRSLSYAVVVVVIAFAVVRNLPGGAWLAP